MNLDVDGIAINRTSDIVKHKILDRDAISGRVIRSSVRLVDEDAIVGAAAHLDVPVGNVLDGGHSSGDGLDADGLLRFRHDDVIISDISNDGSVGNGTDRESVAAGAEAVGHQDVLSRVDVHAVVLVPDCDVGDEDAVGIVDVEPVGILA